MTVHGGTDGGDPLGTARLRQRTLDAWAASAARFREDANAEQELVLGGYRDRLVVELAQNAADAAARAGVPGRLRLTLSEDVLVAANTGEALDADGVESLATLRASAKRDTPRPDSGDPQQPGPVGRFGVGFSAVLAVSDAPAVVGRTGGVRWSLAEAAALAQDRAEQEPAGGLGEELQRREGHVPLLRLPLPAEGTAPEGYDTAVELPLRDSAARELTERLLADVDDALLLTLPGLAEVTVETPAGDRTLTRGQDGPYVRITDTSRPEPTRWRTATDSGVAGEELLADRPLEERRHPVWSVTWAVPVDTAGEPVAPGTAGVVHAPTPTDEPLGVPALLIASFPLESTRRQVAPGPLTDFLLDRAAGTYAALLRDWRPRGTATVGLVPGPLGKGELDGRLRDLLLKQLPEVPFLAGAAPAAADDGTDPADTGGAPEPEPVALRPRDAEIAEGASSATVSVLAELFPSLLPAGLERRPELRALDVSRVPLGEVIDRLAGVERAPEWWWRLYDSLAGVDPDRLTGLPVPLAHSARTAIGPRQVLLPLPTGSSDAAAEPAPAPPNAGPEPSTGPAPAAEALARLGLKVAHPQAAHPLLEKLGAAPATPRAVLDTPQVRSAVANSLDADESSAGLAGPGEPWEQGGAPDAEELADTVLGLVRDARLAPGDEPWLGALALPDEDGELAPASELVLPDSPLEQVIRSGELARVADELVQHWGEQPLTGVGVLASFTLVRAADVVLDPDDLEPGDPDLGYVEPDDVGVLDAVDVWCEDVLDQLPERSQSPVPPVAAELVAVRDLDLVDDDHWPQALAMLSRPPLRDALTAPVRVLLPDGSAESVRPYAAWWLRGHPVLDGRHPAGLRAAGGDPLLDGLYEEADASSVGDPQVLRALGVRTTAAALLDEPGGAAELLARLADPARTVTAAQLHGLYGLLAVLDPDEVTLPDELRAVLADSGEVLVTDAAGAAVADAPDLLPLAGDRPLLPVRPDRAAELEAVLEVPRLSGVLPARVSDAGTERDVPDTVRELLPGAPGSYREHDELLVDGVEVDWRLTPDGVLHAATLEGVAAGLAWAAGAWARRFEAAALLEDPARAAELARSRWFD